MLDTIPPRVSCRKRAPTEKRDGDPDPPVLRAAPSSRSVEPLGRLAQKFGPGVPFVIAGRVKGTYDLILWRLFRTVPIPDDVEVPV